MGNRATAAAMMVLVVVLMTDQVGAHWFFSNQDDYDSNTTTYAKGHLEYIEVSEATQVIECPGINLVTYSCLGVKGTAEGGVFPDAPWNQATGVRVTVTATEAHMDVTEDHFDWPLRWSTSFPVIDQNTGDAEHFHAHAKNGQTHEHNLAVVTDAQTLSSSNAENSWAKAWYGH